MKHDGEFEQFVLTTEPGLRRALAGYMSRDAVSDALAEAFAYAWEHRDRVMRLEHPTGYLFRVAQSKARIRKQGFLPWSPVDATPDIEPDLVPRSSPCRPRSARRCGWCTHADGRTPKPRKRST